jgi:hypothetical protein
MKNEKKMRRSLILVAPTKSSCMRMMLINEDNERTSHSITHSASVEVHNREKKRKKSPFGHSLSLSFYIYTNGTFID